MIPLKIFVDLDGTLNTLQTKWLTAIRRHLGEKLTLKDITSWDRLKDDKYQALLREPGFFLDLGVEVGAQQMIPMIQQDGYDVFVITAATRYDYGDKVAWLERFFPFIAEENIIACRRKELLARPGWVLIDDGPHNIRAWRAAAGIGVVVDQPWNRDLDGLRMKAWAEFPDILARIERGEGAWRPAPS